jgi:hypothetical protein
MSEKSKRRALTRAQNYQLTEAIKARAEIIKQERPSWAQLTRQLCEALKFSTAESAVQEICGLIGLTWEMPTAAGAGAKSRLYGRLEAVEKAAAEARQRVEKAQADADVLRALVHHLYEQVGEKPPAGYTIPPRAAVTVNVK